MSNLLRHGVLLAICALFSATAAAELNAELGVASDYLREGISQTAGKPSLQTGLSYLHNSGFYLGALASSVDHRSDDNLFMEASYFAGAYLPLNKDYAFDLSATYYDFYGDSSAYYQAYPELGVSLIVKDSWSINWRGSNDYLNTGRSWQSLSTSYVYPFKDFNFEVYVANHHWLNKDVADGATYSSDGKSHYWHARIGIERTWNNWDYRFSVERTNLGNEYNAGTKFQFGLHRYFKFF